ncbi:hybrid sensor histidine kinase/response regulator [Halorubrum halophilum]|uniref:hybrid sensor histidine kinase/response regulator n=1 Tax=Halorubrum halophilum TaxID=413816 RepID=UPI00186AC0D0|nr:hybrid sensor histidine kinase/response regulator [Halorubrum halophilum]
MNTVAADQSVLLVEDNPSDAQVYRTMLQELQADPLEAVETTGVDHVESVEAAIDATAASGDPYDAVLLDLNLPDSRGLATVERVLDAAPSAAVVVLTGAGDEEMGKRAVASGAQDFLIKDHVTPRVLVKTISYAVERKRQAATLERQRRRLAALNWLVRHDIRNDAAVVLGWAEGIDPENPAEARAVSRIVEAGESIVASTESAGALLEALDGDGDALVSVVLNDIVEEEVDRLERRHEGVRTAVGGLDDTVVTRADRFLGVVVRNLLDNAVVHNGADAPEVTVDVREREETVVIEVGDNGAGMPERVRRVVAEANDPTDLTDVGLGLFLVGTFVERYGGTLSVEADPDSGTRVRVTLERA